MSVLLRLPAAKRYFTSFRLLGHLSGTYPVASGWLNPTWFSEKFFAGHVGYFRFHSFGTRNKAVLKAWDNRRRNLHCQRWKRTLFVRSRAGREEMNSLGNGNFSENQTLFLSARIQCSGTIADQLTEALMCFGANSVSIEDANSEQSMGQAFSDGPVPWEPRKSEFWNQSCITAIFTADQDVGECLAFAADSIGLKEIPEYKITKNECYNWVQQVQEAKSLYSSLKKPFMDQKYLFSGRVHFQGYIWICSSQHRLLMAFGLFLNGGHLLYVDIAYPSSSLTDPQAINIILDPGFAFGTGEHPTTRLCLLFLREFVNGGEHVLDYGTGSGILSIAALKMGAAKSVGVDTDPMAVSSANRNAALNSFGPDKMQVCLASNDGNNPLSSVAASEGITKGHPVAATSDTGPAEYDIVVANILLNPLLELASQIMGYVKPGGVVGLSGIILDQVPQVRECYSHFLEKMTVSQADGWAFIKGRKKLLQ